MNLCVECGVNPVPVSGEECTDCSPDGGLQRVLEASVAPLLLPRVRWAVQRLLAGEQDPQCRATWPEEPTPATGYAACQFREGHASLHCRPDGCRWEDGGQLLSAVSVDAEFEEQAGFWLSRLLGSTDPETAEYAAYFMGRLRGVKHRHEAHG